MWHKNIISLTASSLVHVTQICRVVKQVLHGLVLWLDKTRLLDQIKTKPYKMLTSLPKKRPPKMCHRLEFVPMPQCSSSLVHSSISTQRSEQNAGQGRKGGPHPCGIRVLSDTTHRSLTPPTLCFHDIVLSLAKQKWTLCAVIWSQHTRAHKSTDTHWQISELVEAFCSEMVMFYDV